MCSITKQRFNGDSKSARRAGPKKILHAPIACLNIVPWSSLSWQKLVFVPENGCDKNKKILPIFSCVGFQLKTENVT